MKKIALVALIVLGLIELSFPVGVAMIFYTFSPQTRRVFATDEQHQLFQKLHVAVNSRCEVVFYFGIATILLGIILLLADRKKKQVA